MNGTHGEPGTARQRGGLLAGARFQQTLATLSTRLTQDKLRVACVLAVVGLAFTLRLMWPGLAEFKIDEVQPLELADRIWIEHRLPLTRGTTSIGLPGTPGLGYLLVLPRMLSADPRVAVAFMGALGGLAVLATYLVVRGAAGHRLALVASALYAANPWAVFLARKTWSEIQPLLTILALWAAYQVIVRRKPRWALAFFPLVALQIQTHLMAVVYLPTVLLTVLLFWPRWKSRYALWGAVAGMLILLPYALGLGAHWEMTRSVLLQRQAYSPRLDLTPLSYGLWFTSGATVTALMGQSVAVLGAWERALRVVNVVTGAMLAWAVALAIRAALARGPARQRAGLLLLWLVGPIAPLVLVPSEMGIHYLLLLVPLLFVLAAMGWERLLASRYRPLAVCSVVAFVTALAVQAGAVVAVYDGISHHPTAGGFGRPLRFWSEVQRGLLAHMAAADEHELQVLGVDDAPWSSERSILDYLLRRSIQLRYVGQGGRTGMLVPEEGETLALAVGAHGELAQALRALGSQQRRWPAVGEDWDVSLYVLQGRPDSVLVRGGLVAQPGVFENGMRLLGARLPETVQPGGTLVALTYWTYAAEGSHPAGTAFNHLVDAEGKRWTQDDGFALRRGDWRSGETLLQWYTLPLPADLPSGDYWLYTGMYSPSDMSRAQRYDEHGQWLDDGVRLGPIRVAAR